MTSSAAPGVLDRRAAGDLAVMSLSQARRHKREFDAVITAEDPGCRPGLRMRFHRPLAPVQLVLLFEDVDDDTLGIQCATEDQVERAIDFARSHRAGSLLVHCFHGVGRSAAIALAILADRHGAGREAEALTALLRIRPEATPNLVVVRHADQILSRGGRLLSALAGWEASTSGMADKRAARAKLPLERPDLYVWVSKGDG